MISLMTNAAMNAPTMFPSPPSTQIMKVMGPKAAPKYGWTEYWIERSAAAIPAIAPPTPQRLPEVLMVGRPKGRPFALTRRMRRALGGLGRPVADDAFLDIAEQIDEAYDAGYAAGLAEATPDPVPEPDLSRAAKAKPTGPVKALTSDPLALAAVAARDGAKP